MANPLALDDLRPGVRVRLLRGHHPGAVCKVMCVQRRQVHLKGISGAPAKALRETFTLSLAFLLSHAEVIR